MTADLSTSLHTYATAVARGARAAIVKAWVSERRARHQAGTNSATKTSSPASVPISAVCCTHVGVSCAWSVLSR
ncbi:hypothetical protein GCM10010247_06910 [Streptomyces calvus]|nr:hypothetical protein GCM10010247_06910 [Streptomyces calvus]